MGGEVSHKVGVSRGTGRDVVNGGKVWLRNSVSHDIASDFAVAELLDLRVSVTPLHVDRRGVLFSVVT